MLLAWIAAARSSFAAEFRRGAFGMGETTALGARLTRESLDELWSH
jgi:hypothetical protein